VVSYAFPEHILIQYSCDDSAPCRPLPPLITAPAGVNSAADRTRRGNSGGKAWPAVEELIQVRANYRRCQIGRVIGTFRLTI
jgi:hypothetical protein